MCLPPLKFTNYHILKLWPLDFKEENDEEDLFSDDDIDDDVISRAAEESLAASQASKLAASQEDTWNSVARVQLSTNADSSFTATQLTHNNKV